MNRDRTLTTPTPAADAPAARRPAGGFLRRRLFVSLALLGLMAGIQGAGGGEMSLPEYQVKALFLLNFTKYVEWPPASLGDTNVPIVIGLLGENKIGDDLQKVVAGKNVGGRNITIRQIESADDLSRCHILFVSSSENKRLAEILGRLKGLPVLTVGETEQFTEQGGIINLTRKEGKVRLEINLESAAQAKLQISSKLLSVADTVKGKSK
jgi:hypothetical protein